MSSDLERYRPVRVSVKGLRDYLTSRGPSSLQTLVDIARQADPRILPEQVERALSSHPAAFERRGAHWVGKPRPEGVVIARRRRPPAPPGSPEPQPRGTRRATASATAPPPAPPRDVVLVGDSVSSVVFGESKGSPRGYESGSRVLVTLTTGRDLDRKRAASLTTAKRHEPVRLYQRLPGNEVVYRGARDVISAYEGTVPGSVLLLLGPGRDDSTQRTVSSRATLLSAPRDAGLVLWRPADFAALQQVVPPSVRPLSRLPSAQTPSARPQAFSQAKALLAPIRDDARRWDDFAQWLASKKPQFDQPLLEQILVMTLYTTGVTEAAVVRLAIVLIPDQEPRTLPFAKEFSVAGSRFIDPLATEYSSRWLAAARRLGGNGADLDLAGARIAWDQSRYEDACRSYGQLASDDQISDLLDLELWLLAAAATGRADFQSRALQQLWKRLGQCETPHDVLALRTSIRESMPFKGSVRSGEELMRDIERLLRIAVANEPDSALREYQTYAHPGAGRIKLVDRLRLLSVLEDLEGAWLVEIHAELLGLTEAVFKQTSESVMWQLWRQLRIAEEAVGDTGHAGSTVIEARIRERADRLGQTPSAPRASPFAGKVVALVGGRPNSRRRTARLLEQLGSTSVVEIPPHWEQKLNQRAVAERVRGADMVALLTDETGHDASNILRELQTALPFKLVHTSGGPSHVVADLLTAA
jgi:hypothetical protein